ncbi:hypothetical protein Pcac1_g13676 [Phytophthora cactorum]|uniref:Uncharacterized protein n=1 Tax=Phytophthora cactorum TaxID=29920 RepID=A0A329SS37_9STRA|nr:hypothetical protein Pcac1_g13676 [Phytophthora cactorum]KAG3102834.1 hypothetical protein PC122_g2058 [Phytophthora cactorum]RAW39375.1 hypothetical protein PC110_g4435 [Phytophthora cactorum]
MTCRAPGGRNDAVFFLQWALSRAIKEITGLYLLFEIVVDYTDLHYGTWSWRSETKGTGENNWSEKAQLRICSVLSIYPVPKGGFYRPVCVCVSELTLPTLRVSVLAISVHNWLCVQLLKEAEEVCGSEAQEIEKLAETSAGERKESKMRRKKRVKMVEEKNEKKMR